MLNTVKVTTKLDVFVGNSEVLKIAYHYILNYLLYIMNTYQELILHIIDSESNPVIIMRLRSLLNSASQK